MISSSRAGACSPLSRFIPFFAMSVLFDAFGLEALAHAGAPLVVARITALVFSSLLAMVAFVRYFTKEEESCLITGAALKWPFIFTYGLFLLFSYCSFSGLFMVGMAWTDYAQRFVALLCCDVAALMLAALFFKTIVNSEGKPLFHRYDVQVIALFLGYAFLSGLFDFFNILTLPHLAAPLWSSQDSDVWLHLTQLRQWIEVGDFYDKSVRHTNAPFGGVTTPWTRVYDAIYVLFMTLLPTSLSLDQRVLSAAAWVPPLSGVAAFIALLYGQKKVVRIKGGTTILAVVAICNAAIQTLYYISGSADHHGLLATLWCGVIALAFQPPQVKRAVYIGALLSVMLWISPEALVLIAGVYALYGGYALFYPRHIRCFAALAQSVASFATLALFIERPFSGLLTDITYDSFSLAHIVALGFIAVFVTLLAPVLERSSSLGVRLAAAGAAGAAFLGMTFLTFPKLFKGPLVDMPVYVYDVLINRVNESDSFLTTNADNNLLILVQPCLALFLLFMFFQRRRKRWLDYAAVALMLVTFLMMVARVRFCYYAEVTSIFVLALRLPLFVRLWRKPKFIRHFTVVERAVISLLFIFGFNAAGYPLVHSIKALQGGTVQQKALTDAADNQCLDDIKYLAQNGKLVEVLGQAPLTIMANPNIGGAIQFFTPYSIVGSLYHREAKGLLDMMRIGHQKTFEEAQALLMKRKVQAVLFCKADYGKDKWMNKIKNSKKPPKWAEILPSKEGILLLRTHGLDK